MDSLVAERDTEHHIATEIIHQLTVTVEQVDGVVAVDSDA